MQLQIQPIQCRQPLPYKEVEREILPHRLRVMFFDPSLQYECMEAVGHGDCFRRVNSLNMEVLFPQVEKKVCACGCGGKLQGRRSRWATEDCSKFALGVYWIICGQIQRSGNYIFQYYGYACRNCGDMNAELHIDHIIPVYAGGGACWLSNLQPLCIDCHKEKTKNDRKLY